MNKYINSTIFILFYQVLDVWSLWKLTVFFILKNNNFSKIRTEEITGWVTTRSLSLRRFTVLLKLCKVDNQPCRLQDKTVRSRTDRLLHSNDRKEHQLLEWFNKTTRNWYNNINFNWYYNISFQTNETQKISMKERRIKFCFVCDFFGV
jgi:hypothetical protein